MLTKSKILLADIEAVEGTPEALTNANTILTTGLQIVPYAGNTVQRDLDQPFLGSKPSINVNPHASLQFGVEFAGSGAAGTAPGFGPLLRACGLSETINVATSVVYAPVSTGFESITAFFLRPQSDGINDQKHVLAGIRGNMGFELSRGQNPLFNFSNFLGSYATPVTAAKVTPDWSAFQAPQAVTYTNTPTITVDGFSACMESFRFDLGNNIVRRNGPGCQATELTDRQATGNIVIRAPDLATKDFFSKLESHSTLNTVAINLVHGLGAGDILTFAAGQAQITNLTEQDLEGTLGYSMDLSFQPTSAGDDEFSLTLT